MASEPVPSPKPTGRRVLGPVLAVAALALPSLWVMNRLIPTPPGLGIQDGRLAACPDKPNCVSSESTDADHLLPAIPWSGTADAARDRIRETVGSMAGARLVAERPGYLHFEFRTRICRFVDDLEFRIDAAAGLIQVRSASRVGYSDLGANRRRVEEIRRRLAG
jgi:uncharacterized protein (DUF1499 family)